MMITAERGDRCHCCWVPWYTIQSQDSWLQVGRVNASAIDADTLEENGMRAPPSAAGCAHQLVLKPYGEQSDPDDPFPVFEGTA